VATEDEIRDVKARHAAGLLARPGVNGIGVERDGEGGYVLAVHLATDDPALVAALPAAIEGHPVRYSASGPYRKLPAVEGGE
jgi:hypothetical protein